MAQALKLLDNLGAWWYNLFGDHSNETSLACLLEVDCECLVKVFNHCGWYTIVLLRGSISKGSRSKALTPCGPPITSTWRPSNKNKKTQYIKSRILWRSRKVFMNVSSKLNKARQSPWSALQEGANLMCSLLTFGCWHDFRSFRDNQGDFPSSHYISEEAETAP